MNVLTTLKVVDTAYLTALNVYPYHAEELAVLSKHCAIPRFTCPIYNRTMDSPLDLAFLTFSKGCCLALITIRSNEHKQDENHRC